MVMPAAFAVFMLMPMLVVMVMAFFAVLVFVRMAVSVLLFTVMMVMVMFLLVLVLFRLMRGSVVDRESHAFALLSLGAIEVHVELTDGELGQFPFQRGRADTEIDQRTNGHVATDAGDAVEIEGFHGQRRGIARC